MELQCAIVTWIEGKLSIPSYGEVTLYFSIIYISLSE
ncbi:MAG: hypothetical protein RLZZ82_393 [Actinomycetota bacterium]|jgi:hypothetical protein